MWVLRRFVCMKKIVGIRKNLVIAMWLNYFGHHINYMTKSHSVLSLKVIFSDLLADNLMFSFNFLESKELETSCFVKWFVTHSLESFTLSLVTPIFHVVICLVSWGFYTPQQCTLLILGYVWKIYLLFRI